MSGGKKTTAKDEGIIEGTLIDIINIGVEYSTGNSFVRASFRGRKSFFQFPIKEHNYEDWTKRVHTFLVESSEDFNDSNDGDLDF